MSIVDPYGGNVDPTTTNPHGNPDVGQGPAPPPPPPASTDNTAGITAAYQKYLGRAPSQSDLMSWMGNNSYEAGISGSPEAKAYAQGQAYTPSYTPMPGWDPTKLNDPNKSDPKYNWARVVQQHPDWLQRGNLDQLVAFYNASYGTKASVAGGDKVDFGDGIGPVDVLTSGGQPWFYPTGAGGGSGTSGAGGSGGASGGQGTAGQGNAYASNTFSDPATQAWEQALNALVSRLNTDQPTWTPAQLELQQTQQLDPLERQRSSQKQQAALRLAQQGVTPTSGIYQATMRQIDDQFDQLRTTAQGGFATQAINRGDTVFANNENRAAQAVNLLFQIPQLADQRLGVANGLQQEQMANLLQLLPTLFSANSAATGQSNVTDAQNQAWMQQIFSMLPGLFGMNSKAIG